jgi:hypothetical protein
LTLTRGLLILPTDNRSFYSSDHLKHVFVMTFQIAHFSGFFNLLFYGFVAFGNNFSFISSVVRFLFLFCGFTHRPRVNTLAKMNSPHFKLTRRSDVDEEIFYAGRTKSTKQFSLYDFSGKVFEFSRKNESRSQMIIVFMMIKSAVSVVDMNNCDRFIDDITYKCNLKNFCFHFNRFAWEIK